MERQAFSMPSNPTKTVYKKKGARKVTKVIDFDEAVREAEAESARIKEASISVRMEQLHSSSSSLSRANIVVPERTTEVPVYVPVYAAAPPSPPVEEFKRYGHEHIYERFGFGFDPSAEPVSAPKAAPKPPTGFGTFPTPVIAKSSGSGEGVKSISSDQYFGRGQFNENARYRLTLYQC